MALAKAGVTQPPHPRRALRSYQAARELVLAALAPAIDIELDYLGVAITGEPVHAGVSKLKS